MITVSQNLLIGKFPLTFPFNFLSISLLEVFFFPFFHFKTDAGRHQQILNGMG